jgi:hypothetical protein
MAFNKSTNPKEISITVTHPWHAGDEYIFHLAKRLSKEATEAQEHYFALTGDEQAGEVRRRRVVALAAMCVREPEGFEDFPTEDDRPLAQRVAEYFDDPEEPELERIVSAVWNRYWQEAVPQAHSKSVQNSGAGSGQPSGVSEQPAPVV